MNKYRVRCRHQSSKIVDVCTYSVIAKSKAHAERIAQSCFATMRGHKIYDVVGKGTMIVRQCVVHEGEPMVWFDTVEQGAGAKT